MRAAVQLSREEAEEANTREESALSALEASPEGCLLPGGGGDGIVHTPLHGIFGRLVLSCIEADFATL